MRGIFYLVVSIYLLLPLIHASLNKDKVVVAINCGSRTAYESEKSGVTFRADQYYNSGVESTSGELYPNSWPDYQDIELYYSERYGKNEAFSYSLPLPKTNIDGHYVLVLKFSEVYFNSARSKIFDVGLGTQTVLWGLDIFDKIGKFAPFDVFIEFDIKNDKVFYLGEDVPSAITKQGELLVNFLKGKADNPKVNAIALVKGTLEDTDYTEFQEFVKNKEHLERLKEQRIREERKVIIEGKLKAEEDLDLSNLGIKYAKGSTRNVEETDPTRTAINKFLSVPYGLETVIISFVVLFFIIFSVVLFNINTIRK